MTTQNLDECHKSFIFKQKIRFKRIGYGSRLSLSFILEKGDQMDGEQVIALQH